MCGHLLQAGFAITVHSRTREKAQGLLDQGAAWADTPREVARAADVLLAIVGFPDDVREVFLGPHGAIAGVGRGAILVDMTTSRPSLAVEIAKAATAVGTTSLDAPVSGGDVGARKGTLSIMIGGDAGAVAALEPCWQALGSTWIRQGGPGAGQHTKMVNQTLIAGNMIGVCEGLLYAHQAGLDLDAVMQSVASGAAGSWSLTNLGPRIIAGNFEPGFFVEHFVKDLGIALEEAERMQLTLPGLALARHLYEQVVEAGGAKQGTHALILALARMSKVAWPSAGA
jgi:3-hydroxyisobutyrate dehydrogenase